MDRPIVYPQALAADTDFLNLGRDTMVAIAALAQAVLGSGPWLYGFAATPGSGLTVSVGAGSIYALGAIDATNFGSLSANATQIVKQGISLTTTSLACPAPGSAGQSINYLIEIAQEDVDTGATVLQFYNSSNPSLPYAGPNNTGASSNTTRSSEAVVQVKAGTAAATGTQVTPPVDSGFVAAWVVTVTYGQTTIPGGQIVVAPSAPFIPQTLPQCITTAAVNALIAAAVAPLATTSALNAAVAPLATSAQLTSDYNALLAAIATAVAPLATSAALAADVATIDAALALLAPLAAPALTVSGNAYPTTPTPPKGDTTTKIANMAALAAALSAVAPTGNNSSPTGPWWDWNPVTGRVEVWGDDTAAISTEGQLTINFPVNIGTYQSASLTGKNNNTSAATVVQLASWSNTGLTVEINDNQGNSSAALTGFEWRAIGYSPTLPVAA